MSAMAAARVREVMRGRYEDTGLRHKDRFGYEVRIGPIGPEPLARTQIRTHEQFSRPFADATLAECHAIPPSIAPDPSPSAGSRSPSRA